MDATDNNGAQNIVARQYDDTVSVAGFSINSPDYEKLYKSSVPNLVKLPAKLIPQGLIEDPDSIPANTIKSGVLYSINGRLYFDASLGVFVMNDGSDDRILIDTDTGTGKASRPGVDVNTAGDEQLTYSTEFTQNPSEWVDFTGLSFSYTSSTRIGVSGGIPSEYFALGDKIEITQTTAKTFFITNVGSNYIDVTSSTGTSVGNAAITSFRLSRTAYSSGHSGYFTKTLGASQLTSDGFTFSSVTGSQLFWMEGQKIHCHTSLSFDITVVGSGTEIYVKLPILRASSSDYQYLDPEHLCNLKVGSTPETADVTHSSSVDSGNSAKILRRTAFTATSYILSFTHVYGIVNQA